MEVEPRRKAYRHKHYTGNDHKGSGAENHWATFFAASHNDEVSATPCTERGTARTPSRGVAETLLHETAGRESRLWRFDRGGCRCGLELSCLWGT
jgi:hypothetical protein